MAGICGTPFWGNLGRFVSREGSVEECGKPACVCETPSIAVCESGTGNVDDGRW